MPLSKHVVNYILYFFSLGYFLNASLWTLFCSHYLFEIHLTSRIVKRCVKLFGFYKAMISLDIFQYKNQYKKYNTLSYSIES